MDIFLQKVLLALSMAILVASSEALLYLIWENRRNKVLAPRPMRFRSRRDVSSKLQVVQDKKGDPDGLQRSSRGDNLGAPNAAVTTATSRTPITTASSSLRERILGGNSGSSLHPLSTEG